MMTHSSWCLDSNYAIPVSQAMAKTTVDFPLKALKLVTSIACVGLFLWMSWGIFRQYSRRDTVTVSSEVPKESNTPPVLAICAENWYLNRTATYVTKEEYLNNTVNITAMILNMSYTTIQGDGKDEGFELKETHTILSGRCVTIRYRGKVTEDQRLVFSD